MLEQPDYYLAQLDRPRDERPPEWRSSAWVDTVLRSALLEVKERDALAGEVERLRSRVAQLEQGIRLECKRMCDMDHTEMCIEDCDLRHALAQSQGGNHE